MSWKEIAEANEESYKELKTSIKEVLDRFVFGKKYELNDYECAIGDIREIVGD